jgi:hypothetical protein
MYGERRRGVYRVLVVKPKGKKPLGRGRHRWKDNIIIYFQKVGLGHGLNLSGSEQGQVVGSCECGNEPSC